MAPFCYAGCWMEDDVGCWILDVGLEKIKSHRCINVGFWILD